MAYRTRLLDVLGTVLLAACNVEIEKSTDAPDGSSTTATGGATDQTGGATTNGPGGATMTSGSCYDEYHGPYSCQCTPGTTEPCPGGVRMCFSISRTVITDYVWGHCGECAPGDVRACEIDGTPGTQSCDPAEYMLYNVEVPTPQWAMTCVPDDPLASTPG